MIYSMTGFGKSTFTLNSKNYTIELRSLNSKQLDLNVKLPQFLREKENQIRQILSNELKRGKVDLSIYIDNLNGQSNNVFDFEVINNYLNQLKSGFEDTDIQVTEQSLQSILRLPDVIVSQKESFDENTWEIFKQHLLEATNAINLYRQEEGEALKKDLILRIDKIKHFLEEIPQYEPKRIEKVKERLHKYLSENANISNIDENRFEQELIYFLEKFDITEEKIRLATHCKYFIENINAGEMVGKKLNFISQEIGREINTIGSKANDSDIQKIVVQMKDELEKIKEQSFNIL